MANFIAKFLRVTNIDLAGSTFVCVCLFFELCRSCSSHPKLVSEFIVQAIRFRHASYPFAQTIVVLTCSVYSYSQVSKFCFLLSKHYLILSNLWITFFKRRCYIMHSICFWIIWANLFLTYFQEYKRQYSVCKKISRTPYEKSH